jgi:hypothetical protein
MGRREIFHTFSLLVEIEGHFTHEFVTYVYETVGRSFLGQSTCMLKKIQSNVEIFLRSSD